MTSEITCERCGGPMVPGVPGDVYCPNNKCFQNDLESSLRIVRAAEKRERRKLYEKLKKEFENE